MVQKLRKYREDHPDKWDVAYREVLQEKRDEYQRVGRPKMIAECLIKQGVKESCR